MNVLENGVFPQHNFALIGFLGSVDVVLQAHPFTTPHFAADVFGSLLRFQMSGKKLSPGKGNILHVEQLIIQNRRMWVMGRRCDYAHYLGLARSAEKNIDGNPTLVTRYGRHLYEVWRLKGFDVAEAMTVTFPPFGCTLGLTGMYVSSDGYLVTKKKPRGDTTTATDHGRRLHLGASQIRFDHPSRCFSPENGSPLPFFQMLELVSKDEGTAELAANASISPFAVGIFLQDHHPELFYIMRSQMTGKQILDEVKNIRRPEGDFELIPLRDHALVYNILKGKDDCPFADHHAGGLITFLYQSGCYWSDRYEEFLPAERLPASFS